MKRKELLVICKTTPLQIVSHAIVQDLSAILIVGRYSECSLLHDAVKERFPHLKVIVPREAGLAVLKGAVITGHCPNIITERISRYTYGLACRTIFNKGVHKEEYKVVDDVGVARCDNVFKRHVAVEESVTLGKSCETNGYYCVSRPTDTSLSINIYASTEPSPMYTTDKSCQKLDTLKIRMPDTSQGLNRGVEVSMSFGGTEIEVEAVHIHSKKKHTAFFDFLG